MEQDSVFENSFNYNDDNDSPNQLLEHQQQSEQLLDQDDSGSHSLSDDQTAEGGTGFVAKRKLGPEVMISSANGNEMEVDGASDLDGNETPAKKPSLEINIRKLLPELEKHWKPVEDDPSDFSAWTFLLQYVDQENELLAAREAYDTFLGRYSYCYGYWKKFADFEKRNGSAFDCEQVFCRGLKAIPLSVDLWIHYLNYVKATHENDNDYIRSKFQESIAACGLEFRSDKLWEHYIHWEKEVNALKNVLEIYDVVISTPTQSHQTHFQNLKSFVEQYAPEEILGEEELAELKSKLESEPTSEEVPNEANLLREKLMEKRTEIYKKNEEEINARWTFEEAIKRPYFHVKPLEKGQLKNWKEYLDFEIGKGDEKRINILFERCLIACALYEEYWMKYISYLQAQPNKNVDLIREVFTRACTIYHPNKLWINLFWCAFEESQGNMSKVNELFDKLEKNIPNSLHVFYKRIHFERRNGNLSGCEALFEKYIEATKGKITSIYLTIKYAYFLHYNLGNLAKAVELLQSVESEDEQLQATVLMALIDLGFRQRDPQLISSAFQEILESKVSNEIKINFAHRNIEFLEETSNNVESILKAHEQLQSLAKSMKPKRIEDEPVPSVVKEANKPVNNESVPYQSSTHGVAAATPVTQFNGAVGTATATYSQYGSPYSGGWDPSQSQPPPNYATPTNGTTTFYNQQQQPSWGSYPQQQQQQQGYYG